MTWLSSTNANDACRHDPCVQHIIRARNGSRAMSDKPQTDAEKRDATLRTVELPDCCGNCVYFYNDQAGVTYCEKSIDRCCFDDDDPYNDMADYNQLCDLHERRQ